jgi:hypothetical protein
MPCECTVQAAKALQPASTPAWLRTHGNCCRCSTHRTRHMPRQTTLRSPSRRRIGPPRLITRSLMRLAAAHLGSRRLHRRGRQRQRRSGRPHSACTTRLRQATRRQSAAATRATRYAPSKHPHAPACRPLTTTSSLHCLHGGHTCAWRSALRMSARSTPLSSRSPPPAPPPSSRALPPPFTCMLQLHCSYPRLWPLIQVRDGIGGPAGQLWTRRELWRPRKWSWNFSRRCRKTCRCFKPRACPPCTCRQRLQCQCCRQALSTSFLARAAYALSGRRARSQRCIWWRRGQ